MDYRNAAVADDLRAVFTRITSRSAVYGKHDLVYILIAIPDSASIYAVALALVRLNAIFHKLRK
jgi:uncharacterized protein with GYD domain